MADTPQAAAGFLGKFTVLRGAARELWIAFFAKLLVIAAYALTNSTLVLWLSSDFGYSDQRALAMVAFWSLADDCRDSGGRSADGRGGLAPDLLPGGRDLRGLAGGDGLYETFNGWRWRAGCSPWRSARR